MKTPDQQMHAFRAFRNADEKYRNGDGITNHDLAILIERYRAASEAMRACWHPSYSLVSNDVSRRLDELEGFQRARAGTS